MPKLLFVGIVERVCRATVIREIPGISECFQVKESNKDEGAVIKVKPLKVFVLCLLDDELTRQIACNKWFQSAWDVGIF